jgi:hypothetical protein
MDCQVPLRVRYTRAAAMALLATILAIVANRAMAQTNLVQNPYFSQATPTGSAGIQSLTTIAASEQFGTFQASGCTTGTSCYTPGQTLTDWTSPGGYSFVFMPPLTTAANDSYGTANLALDSAVSVYNATNPNFLGADGNTGVAAIQQLITGLTPGKAVAVSFSWAGAQQSGFNCTGNSDDICTSTWTVDLGSSTAVTTPIASYGTQGFTGWLSATYYFVPTAASEALSFVAGGSPTSGAPPFALLTNISVTTVPEPGSLAVIVSGIIGLTALRRRPRARGPARVVA